MTKKLVVKAGDARMRNTSSLQSYPINTIGPCHGCGVVGTYVLCRGCMSKRAQLRMLGALIQRLQGCNFTLIGSRLGVSHERARQIVFAACRKIATIRINGEIEYMVPTCAEGELHLGDPTENEATDC